VRKNAAQKLWKRDWRRQILMNVMVPAVVGTTDKACSAQGAYVQPAWLMTETLLETFAAYYVATWALLQSVLVVVEKFRTNDALIWSVIPGRWANGSDPVLVTEEVQHVGISDQVLRGVGAFSPFLDFCERAPHGMHNRMAFFVWPDDVQPLVLFCRPAERMLYRGVFDEGFEGCVVIGGWQSIIESLKGARFHKINHSGLVSLKSVDDGGREDLISTHSLDIWVRCLSWQMVEGCVVLELEETTLSSAYGHALWVPDLFAAETRELSKVYRKIRWFQDRIAAQRSRELMELGLAHLLRGRDMARLI
jgi:hypothetical protein